MLRLCNRLSRCMIFLLVLSMLLPANCGIGVYAAERYSQEFLAPSSYLNYLASIIGSSDAYHLWNLVSSLQDIYENNAEDIFRRFVEKIKQAGLSAIQEDFISNSFGNYYAQGERIVFFDIMFDEAEKSFRVYIFKKNNKISGEFLDEIGADTFEKRSTAEKKGFWLSEHKTVVTEHLAGGQPEYDTGAGKLIGPQLHADLLKTLRSEDRHKNWLKQASKVEPEYYSKDIEFPELSFGFTSKFKHVPVKLIWDETLPESIDSWSLWEKDKKGEKKCLVIAVRALPAPHIRDELIFHELLESRWIEHLTVKYCRAYNKVEDELLVEEKERIVRSAHILTWVKQAQIFKDEEGVTPLHKYQLEQLGDEALQSLVYEFYDDITPTSGRAMHRELIFRELGSAALEKAETYVSGVIDYVQKLLSGANSGKLFDKLNLGDGDCAVKVFLRELGIELDTANKDRLANEKSIPIVIKNIRFFKKHFRIRSRSFIYAYIEMSDYGPAAIRFQDERRHILVDISSLTILDRGEDISNEMVQRLNGVIEDLQNRGYDKVMKCRLVGIDKWHIDKIPELFGTYSPGSMGATKLTELAIMYAKKPEIQKEISVLDMGSGTGVLGVAVANETSARVVCADVKKTAVVNSKISAVSAGQTGKVTVTESGLFDNLVGKKFDIITVNAVGGLYHGMDILPRDSTFFEDLFYQFADHLTRDGVMLLSVPAVNIDVKRLMHEFVDRKFLVYEEVYAHGDDGEEQFSIYAVKSHPEKKKDPVIGPLKMMGPKLTPYMRALLRQREIRKGGWRQQAVKVEKTEYKKVIANPYGDPIEIDIPVKVIQVTDLPEDVTVSYFCATDKAQEKCLVIVTREEFPEDILDEVVFYGYIHARWSEKLTEEHPGDASGLSDEEKEDIRHEAHILASSQQALIFKSFENISVRDHFGERITRRRMKLTGLHGNQLESMELEQLEQIVSEHKDSSEYYNDIRERRFNWQFMEDIKTYEEVLRQYAIRRELEYLTKKTGFVIANDIKGRVRECYFDWGGTLSDSSTGKLEAHELRYLFWALKEYFGPKLKIHIITEGASVDAICNSLGIDHVLAYIDSVVSVKTIENKGKAPEYEGSGVKMIGSGYTKTAYIKKQMNQSGYSSEDKVLFFDNDGANFGYDDMRRIIKIGVIGKQYDPKFKALIDEMTGAPIGRPDYYIRLHELEAVLDFVRFVRSGQSETETEGTPPAITDILSSI